MVSDTSIADTLAQRGAAYGDFREQGRITQNLKRAMQDSPNWHRLPSYIKEGLDMIQHKVSRMLNGDALYDDNVHDIVGYTKLMQDRMKQDRDAGTVFETGGDKLYPVYDHEDHKEANEPSGGRLQAALQELYNLGFTNIAVYEASGVRITVALDEFDNSPWDIIGPLKTQNDVAQPAFLKEPLRK